MRWGGSVLDKEKAIQKKMKLSYKNCEYSLCDNFIKHYMSFKCAKYLPNPETPVLECSVCTQALPQRGLRGSESFHSAHSAGRGGASPCPVKSPSQLEQTRSGMRICKSICPHGNLCHLCLTENHQTKKSSRDQTNHIQSSAGRV